MVKVGGNGCGVPKMPWVTVLIPHHRHHALLPPLFSSLLNMEMEADDAQLVLVDNGSTDGSVDRVRCEFPTVRIFSLESNAGFAPALNRAARAFSSEWLCFLNNDVRVDPDWLPNLLHASRKIDSPCFASHILDWMGKKTQFAGGWINWFGKGFESDSLSEDQPYEIFFPCGGAMMIRREVFLDIGGFDDDYFMIYEDVDLGWRLRLYGYSVYLVPDAYVMHRGHYSLGQETYSRKALYLERNSLATLYKNLNPASLAVLFPLALREAMLRAKALGGIGIPARYSPDGLATLNGVKAFFDGLPRWREKRAVVQRRRCVEDAEIFARFFSPSTQKWAYGESHYRRLFLPDVEREIDALLQRARAVVP